MLPSERILRITPSLGPHFMETGDAVSGLEFPDFRSDAVDDSCDVVAAVGFILQ
jgi:hypothetical protein